ncbi:MAG: tRNA uridine-5-carboxymethylaminomethyl(34) synthesis GTPase MnmE [Candidatus Rifleibacteriota bacterium]
MYNPGVDTIAAVSTPAGRAAISLIRLSGPDAFKILDKVFKKGGKRSFPLAYSAFFGSLIDPDNNCVVDKVIVTTFIGPHSFTGENTAEISCHGNPVLVSRILAILLKAGARLAEAGEFSRRAFINGKIDLLEVEALSQLLSAETTTQIQLAMNQLDGLPSRQIAGFRDRIIAHLVQLEASLNFPEDAIEAIDEHHLARELDSIRKELEIFAENAKNGGLVAGGLKIALIGRPNSGKSSLMNYFLGRDRAIVTEIAGTTRDTLEETVHIGSIPIKLIDTAGLRDPGDKVEAIGIERTRKAIDEAFALIGVFDGSRIETIEDEQVLRALKESEKPFIIVRNKVDLPQKMDANFFAGFEEVGISTLQGIGLPLLVEKLKSILDKSGISNFESMVLLGAQQQNSLDKALAAIERACAGIGEIYQDMLAIELEEAVRELGRITGETVDLNTLDLIFERFCIGK